MAVTLDDIRRLVGVQLGLDAVGERDRLVEDLGAESFDLLNLASAVEERYGIILEDDDTAGVATVADFFELVRRKAID